MVKHRGVWGSQRAGHNLAMKQQKVFPVYAEADKNQAAEHHYSMILLLPLRSHFSRVRLCATP